jgi:hypothetical protein
MKRVFEKYPRYIRSLRQNGSAKTKQGCDSSTQDEGRFRLIELYCFLNDLQIPFGKIGVGLLRILWLSLYWLNNPNPKKASFRELSSIFRHHSLSYIQFVRILCVILATVFKPASSSEACALLSTDRFFRRFQKSSFFEIMEQKYSLECMNPSLESLILPKKPVPLRPFETFETTECMEIEKLLLRL